MAIVRVFSKENRRRDVSEIQANLKQFKGGLLLHKRVIVYNIHLIIFTIKTKGKKPDTFVATIEKKLSFSDMSHTTSSSLHWNILLS